MGEVIVGKVDVQRVSGRVEVQGVGSHSVDLCINEDASAQVFIDVPSGGTREARLDLVNTSAPADGLLAAGVRAALLGAE